VQLTFASISTRLNALDAETVELGGAVEHHRVLADLFSNPGCQTLRSRPTSGLLQGHHRPWRRAGRRCTLTAEPSSGKALVELELRPGDDHRTPQ
jgi:hypothetical protein